MSSSFTCAATIVQDPEKLTLGGKDCAKIRCVDKSISKKAEDRFFNAILHGLDAETALRLAKGDQILITGTLQQTSYMSKKTGGKVMADEMGFGTRILRVLKSPSFFEGKGEKADEGTPEHAPAPDSTGQGLGYSNAAQAPAGPSPLDGIL